MSLASEAYSLLYPDKIPSQELKVRYSRKFNAYNANVRYNASRMEFHLSRQWKEVSKEIQIGLIQSLMLKALKDKKRTMNIDLYNIFLKKIHLGVPKSEQDPVLLSSFERVNEKYFDGMIEAPNLMFGSESKRKLGSYEYGSDTIIISSILKGHVELIDYVMYHEMLHKKYKFNVKNGRSFHHTAQFRQEEMRYENHQQLEKMLSAIVRRRRFFSWF